MGKTLIYDSINFEYFTNRNVGNVFQDSKHCCTLWDTKENTIIQDNNEVTEQEEKIYNKKSLQEVTHLPIEMTYLGSGIWSYTCKREGVQSLLHKVWLRTNPSFELDGDFIQLHRSTSRWVIIQPAFTQIYCSQRSQTETSERQSARNPQCLWAVTKRTASSSVSEITHTHIPLFHSSHLPQSRSHLIGQRPCHDHDVRLPGARSEHDSEAVHVVTGRRHVHHLHRATRQPKGHRPQRALRGKHSDDSLTQAW